MNPSIPSTPNLKDDPRFAGAVDLDKVREESEKERAEKAAREEQAMHVAIYAWQKAMRKTFKGISGSSTLHRRFHMRAQLKKMEREGQA